MLSGPTLAWALRMPRVALPRRGKVVRFQLHVIMHKHAVWAGQTAIGRSLAGRGGPLVARTPCRRSGLLREASSVRSPAHINGHSEVPIRSAFDKGPYSPMISRKTAWYGSRHWLAVESPGESLPQTLSEPCVNLSIYTAPIIQPFCGHGLTGYRWANRSGYSFSAFRSASRARFRLPGAAAADGGEGEAECVVSRGF
jgi:hypothetical protein